VIERNLNEHTREVLRKSVINFYQISTLITLRMLILISQDNLTIQYGLNRNNSLISRSIAFRILNNPTNFQDEFRILLNDEEESPDIRIIAFQAISSFLNPSEINNLIEKVQSTQLRFYMKSLFKQSSIWLANSGSYIFSFGKINVIFNENASLFFPNMIQFELADNSEIDFYFVRYNE